MATDFLTLRADWKAAGRPGPESGHPYWDVDTTPTTTASPLAISLTAGQIEFMERYAPVARAQSDANVAATMRRGR